jgi:hypothetical protein
MDFFIKKIFSGKSDNLVHLQFQKYSRGEFKDKANVKVTNSGNKFTMATGYEYANELVRAVAEKLGNNKSLVTGGVITTKDLTNELEFKDKKQFMGVKQYVIEKEMTGKEIMDICDKFPTSFIALSFSAGDTELKIKAKAPKSAKPSTKVEEKPKIDFCKLITTDRNLFQAMIFEPELQNVKKAEIYHDLIIKDIILPKGEKDFAKMREMAKRKGKIVRKIFVDEKETRREAEFEA